MSERRLSLLFLIPSLQMGGAERVATCLLRHIDRTKYNVTLAVLDATDPVYAAELPPDIRILYLNCRRVRHSVVTLLRLVWRERPDIVFSTLGHLNLAISMLRPFMPTGTRYVARETSIVSLLQPMMPFYFWWGWAYRRFLSNLDTVVCQSETMRADLVQNFGFPRRKAIVINNPVDTERIRSLAMDPVDTGFDTARTPATRIELVAAGRLVRVKGFDLLIRAIALCGDSRLRLTILGDGPLREGLQRTAEEHGVAGQIRFAGNQSNPYPFFAQADALVLSSRFEGFPNVVLEAMACGTPVISTPAPGGVREILARVNGCALAESLTAEALAAAIKSFDFGRGLKSEAVERYAVSPITRRYELVFSTGL